MEAREYTIRRPRDYAAMRVERKRRAAERRRRITRIKCGIVVAMSVALMVTVGFVIFDSNSTDANASWADDMEVIDYRVDTELTPDSADAEELPENDENVIEMTRVLCRVEGYDGDVDYSALIRRVYNIARKQEDPADEGLLYILCELLESQRNLKLIDLGRADEQTDIFSTFADWNEIYDTMDPKPEHVPYVNYTEAELEKAAAVLYGEAGASWCTDQHRRDVAVVLVNRIKDGRFPNTVTSVVYARGQYATCNLTYYDQRCYNIMKDALENGPWDGDTTTVWQSNYVQGKEIVRVYDYPAYGSTTYICR